MEDDNGDEYLVFESYPLINPANQFSVTQNCDETCFLNNVTPSIIKIYNINASIYIDKFNYSTQTISNISSKIAQNNTTKCQDKIDRMNLQLTLILG